MIKNKFGKKLSAVLLAGVMTLGLAACGSAPGTTDETGSEGEFVYVPEWHSLSGEGDGWQDGFVTLGNRMYYQQSVYTETESHQDYRYLDLTNLDAEPVVVYEMSTENASADTEYSTYISQIFPAEDGSIVIIEAKSPNIPMDENSTEADWERQQQENLYNMKKIAEDGTEVFSVDITEQIHMSEISQVSHTASDKDGNLYFSNGNDAVWIFDKDGNFTNLVKMESNGQFGGYINDLGVLDDGRAAILQDSVNGIEIKAYNAEKKSFTDTYSNLPPNCYNSNIAPGLNGGVLLNGQDFLYEYDLTTQTYTEVIKWIDCDLNRDYIEYVSALDNGNIAIYYRDWNSDERSIVLLKKTPASEVVSKETLTLGCLSLSQNLQSTIVNFNKQSDTYRIEVKDYTASIDWSQENASDAYEDAISKFYNDLVTGNAPDLFATGGIVDLKQLAAKGVLEDLNSYLESSDSVKREDLIAPVLDAYTVDGALYSIPVSFGVSTLVGRTAEVGEESGWTMEEMMEFAAQYPDAEIFNGTTRDSLLLYCMMFNFEAYVNWETGECSFDSPEFKKVLEFVAQYPSSEEMDWENRPSEPAALRTHSALLYMFDLSSPESTQLVAKMFEEPVTAIGFPSSTSTGVVVTGQDDVCISASSKNKEAAWKFIEFQLEEENMENQFIWNFPIRKSLYDKKMEEQMTPEYQTDENGNPVLDENGNPIEYSKGGWSWGDDITVDIYAVTQEEADKTWEIINRIGGVASYNEQLMNIINEEAAPFFAGQKSVDEVADIIQSRIKVYVNESR